MHEHQMVFDQSRLVGFFLGFWNYKSLNKLLKTFMGAMRTFDFIYRVPPRKSK